MSWLIEFFGWAWKPGLWVLMLLLGGCVCLNVVSHDAPIGRFERLSNAAALAAVGLVGTAVFLFAGGFRDSGWLALLATPWALVALIGVFWTVRVSVWRLRWRIGVRRTPTVSFDAAQDASPELAALAMELLAVLRGMHDGGPRPGDAHSLRFAIVAGDAVAEVRLTLATSAPKDSRDLIADGELTLAAGGKRVRVQVFGPYARAASGLRPEADLPAVALRDGGSTEGDVDETAEVGRSRLRREASLALLALITSPGAEAPERPREVIAGACVSARLKWDPVRTGPARRANRARVQRWPAGGARARGRGRRRVGAGEPGRSASVRRRARRHAARRNLGQAA